MGSFRLHRRFEKVVCTKTDSNPRLSDHRTLVLPTASLRASHFTKLTNGHFVILYCIVYSSIHGRSLTDEPRTPLPRLLKQLIVDEFICLATEMPASFARLHQNQTRWQIHLYPARMHHAPPPHQPTPSMSSSILNEWGSGWFGSMWVTYNHEGAIRYVLLIDLIFIIILQYNIISNISFLCMIYMAWILV